MSSCNKILKLSEIILNSKYLECRVRTDVNEINYFHIFPKASILQIPTSSSKSLQIECTNELERLLTNYDENICNSEDLTTLFVENEIKDLKKNTNILFRTRNTFQSTLFRKLFFYFEDLVLHFENLISPPEHYKNDEKHAVQLLVNRIFLPTHNKNLKTPVLNTLITKFNLQKFDIENKDYLKFLKEVTEEGKKKSDELEKKLRNSREYNNENEFQFEREHIFLIQKMVKGIQGEFAPNTYFLSLSKFFCLFIKLIFVHDLSIEMSYNLYNEWQPEQLTDIFNETADYLFCLCDIIIDKIGAMVENEDSQKNKDNMEFIVQAWKGGDKIYSKLWKKILKKEKKENDDEPEAFTKARKIENALNLGLKSLVYRLTSVITFQNMISIDEYSNFRLSFSMTSDLYDISMNENNDFILGTPMTNLCLFQQKKNEIEEKTLNIVRWLKKKHFRPETTFIEAEDDELLFLVHSEITSVVKVGDSKFKKTAEHINYILILLTNQYSCLEKIYESCTNELNQYKHLVTNLIKKNQNSTMCEICSQSIFSDDFLSEDGGVKICNNKSNYHIYHSRCLSNDELGKNSNCTACAQLMVKIKEEEKKEKELNEQKRRKLLGNEL